VKLIINRKPFFCINYTPFQYSQKMGSTTSAAPPPPGMTQVAGIMPRSTIYMIIGAIFIIVVIAAIVGYKKYGNKPVYMQGVPYAPPIIAPPSTI
jgi:hypothetical protein